MRYIKSCHPRFRLLHEFGRKELTLPTSAAMTRPTARRGGCTPSPSRLRFRGPPSTHSSGRGLTSCFTSNLGLAKPLAAAVAAYPEARVELGEKGITLRPSRPPVARLALAGGATPSYRFTTSTSRSAHTAPAGRGRANCTGAPRDLSGGTWRPSELAVAKWLTQPAFHATPPCHKFDICYRFPRPAVARAFRQPEGGHPMPDLSAAHRQLRLLTARVVAAERAPGMTEDDIKAAVRAMQRHINKRRKEVKGAATTTVMARFEWMLYGDDLAPQTPTFCLAGGDASLVPTRTTTVNSSQRNIPV